MLEAYLAGLWNPADERAVPSPYEKDCTQSIIDELQRKLDFETSIIAEHQRILKDELQKRKRFIAPIRRVPDDILVEILDLALLRSPRQIWRFLRVCRRWHQLFQSHAWLWSHIKVDLTGDVGRPNVGLVSKWRERAWGINQTIDLQLLPEQFGVLKGMLKGGLKYITHLRLTIPYARTPPKFDLPPALPCLRHLVLNNKGIPDPFELTFLITSLCHQFFTRRQTRRTGSVARFHLEFYGLGFNKLPRAMNCVHTVVLSRCIFTGPSQILQFLEAAKFTIKHLEYTLCGIPSPGTLSNTRPLTFPSLLTLKHYARNSRQRSLLPILFCPALKALTIGEGEAILCTVAQYPAIQELCLVKENFKDASHADSPLVRDSKLLETLTISQLYYTPWLDHSSVVRRYKRMNLDMYTGSLRRIRFHFDIVRGLVEQVKFELREVANDFARRGRDIELELVREGDSYDCISIHYSLFNFAN